VDIALFSTFIVGLTNFAFTLVSFWIIGSIGMTVALVFLVVISETGQFHGVIVLVLILTYLAFFASCIGPVFWTLVPEIFPNRIRGRAMTIPVLTQWVANAIVVLFFPFAFHQIGKSATFAFLALICLSQAVFAWFFLPETKNKPLEEIEEFWNVNAGDPE
jgi:MFS family permease